MRVTAVVEPCTSMISTHALALWAVMLAAADVGGQAFVPTGGVSPFVASLGHRGVAVSPTGSRRCRGRGHDASMASSVAPAPRTKAEKTSEHFKLKEAGMVEFGSGQRVEVCYACGWPGEKRERGRWVVGVAAWPDMTRRSSFVRETKHAWTERKLTMTIGDSSRRG